MSDATQNDLEARASRGDRAAFEALIQREKAGLYAFARRYVGDRDEAYDATQDAFIAAWRSIGNYDPKRSFSVWLKTITLNKCRDLARRAKVRRLVHRAFALEPKPDARAQDEAGDDRLQRLDAAVARLPPIYKDPLLLTTSGGLSQEEAAGVLHTSRKAVEMRLRRARRRLAEMLADGGKAE